MMILKKNYFKFRASNGLLRICFNIQNVPFFSSKRYKTLSQSKSMIVTIDKFVVTMLIKVVVKLFLKDLIPFQKK
jgi:hypothetical protein